LFNNSNKHFDTIVGFLWILVAMHFSDGLSAGAEADEDAADQAKQQENQDEPPDGNPSQDEEMDQGQVQDLELLQ